MSYCSFCGHINADDATVCSSCKKTLVRVCNMCQVEIPVMVNFCPNCGTLQRSVAAHEKNHPQLHTPLHSMMPDPLAIKMKQAITNLSGERRETTVLCWLINIPSEKSGYLDTETRYLLSDQIIRQLAEIIYHYEGTIDRYSGHDLVAFFGTPIAHENDAERAVRAALDIHNKLLPLISNINNEHHTHVTTQIGIHTGKVIVSKNKQNSQMNYTIVGNIIDRTQILRDAAEPNSILVSFDTYQRTQPLIHYDRLPLLTTRGSRDLVWAFQPSAVKKQPGPVRGLSDRTSPMVGRDDPLHWLQTVWHEVMRKQQSRVAIITGEAGVGKTRLVSEFCQEIQKSAQIYTASCMTYARITPLHLIKELLRNMLCIDETKSSKKQYRQLSDVLTHLSIQKADILPYLTIVLDLEHNNQDIDTMLNNLDDAALQKLTHAAIRQVIEVIAHTQPMVLVLEDLHWVDSASRSVINYLMQTLDYTPILLILISRSSERSTVLQPLIDTSKKLQYPMLDLRLYPLSPDAITELITHILHKTSDAASLLIKQIVIRAGGNPFYAEEIVRMLVDHGGIHRIRDTWYISNKAEELIEKTPGTVGDLILARFDSLDEEYRDVLSKAAVCGMTFPTSLLIRLSESDNIEIGSVMDLLVRRKFIIPAEVIDGDYFAFNHALIHEVIYNTILRKDRQNLHNQIASVLDENDALFGEQERIELLAHHYAASKTPEKAVPYLLRAAESAARRCDYETAIKQFRETLKNISPHSPAHNEDILQAKIGLGRALKFTGQNSESSNVLHEALQAALFGSIKVDLLARIVDGLRELAEIRHIEGAPDQAIEYLEAGVAAVEDKGKQQYITLWRSLVDSMAWIHFRKGELEKAFELAGSATLGLNPEREDDPMTLASLYNTLGGVLWEQGNLSEAVSYVQLSSRLYTEQRYIWGMANTDVNLGVLYYAQGNWQNAAKHFSQADEYWLQMGDLQQRAVTLNNLGTLYQGMGQFEKANEYFDTSLDLFQRLGDIWGSARVHTSLARFYMEQSEIKLAQEHVTFASDLLKVVSAEDVELLWIQALIQAGSDFDSALVSAEKALELARESNLVDQEAECLLALGKLRVQSGDYQFAESLFRESVDLNLQAHAPYGHGLALLELGKLYHLLSQIEIENTQDWHNRAVDILQQAENQFTKLGASCNVAQTQNAINELQTAPFNHEEKISGYGIPGTDIDQHQNLPDGDHRQATIVNIHFTPAVNADEEDIFEILTQVTVIITATAQRYHGQIIHQRNGMMLVFGAPQAYEDDPERAVSAAWEILENLQKENFAAHPIIQHGIAVTQGQVIAGNIGAQFHKEFMVEGKPVDAARQLVTMIPAGEIWVSDAVKNTSKRIAIYQPAGESGDLWRLEKFDEHPAQMRGIPGLRTRLIGRESDLNKMVHLTKHLSEGIGGLIWIDGEPGIGKSRLMNEFVSVMDTQGIGVWQGGCSPQTTEVAFALFTDLLGQRFDINPRDPARKIQEKVFTALAKWPRSLQITQPYLEVLLGAWPNGLPGERLAKLEPEQLRQQIFVSLRRFFKILSQENPLVIVFDDLHWVDTISAELLQFLLTLIATSPILFVCAQRRQGSDAPNDRLVRIQSLVPSQTCYLHLQRLTQAERETLLDELLPRNLIPENIRTSILSQSDGNPYFIEEFIRMLVEQGYLAQMQEHWVMSQTLNTDQISLPTSLDSLIKGRIDALPSDLKQVIQIAAVLGAPFEVEIIREICHIADIESTLDRLASRLLISRVQDGFHWTFHHPLIEIVAYKSILNIRLQAYHQRIAEILETRWAGAESEHAETLAYHLTRANQSARALSYLITAGERAAVKFANEQAVSYFEQAAQVLSTLPGSSDTLRWRLAAGLGDVYRAMGHYDDSMAALRAGMALIETGRLDANLRAGLYRRMGDTTRKMGDYKSATGYFQAATLLLDEPENAETHIELARILCGLSWTLFHQGLIDEARETAELGLLHAEKAESVVDLAAIENLLGGIYYSQSKWSAASQHTRKAMVLREQMGYTWGVASTLGNLGVLAVLEGDWYKAHSFFERSLHFREEMDDVEGLALVHNNLGMLLRDQGNLDQAESHFRSSLEASKPFAHSYHSANATLGLAYVLFLKGEQKTSRQMLARALKLAEGIGASDVITEAHRVQVEMYYLDGDYESALDTAYTSLEQAQESGSLEHQASLWRLISSIELAQGNIKAAEHALEQTKEILSSVTNMLELGRTHAQAACIAIAIEDYKSADAYLNTAQGIFMKLGADLDITKIHELAVYRSFA